MLLDKLRLFVLKKALKKTRGRLPPFNSSASQDETKPRNRYFIIFQFVEKGKRYKFGVYRILNEGIEGKIFENTGNGACGGIPFNLMKGKVYFSRHLLENYEFKYYSSTKFLVWEYLQIPRMIILQNRLAQFWYNSRTPIRTDRIEILKN